jgi:hypothetical protein
VQHDVNVGKLGELEKVWRKAFSLVSAGNWRIIDGNKPARDVGRVIVDALRLPFL